MSAFWRNSYYRVPADVAEKAIEQMRREHGIVSPSIIIQHAKKARHPLHPIFTWDNTEAAEQFRLWQARQMLSALVVVTTVPGGEVKTRAYVAVSVADQRERDYKPIQIALRDDREEVLARAMAEIQRWREKYARLEELADLFKLIDEKTEVPAAA